MVNVNSLRQNVILAGISVSLHLNEKVCVCVCGGVGGERVTSVLDLCLDNSHHLNYKP